MGTDAESGPHGVWSLTDNSPKITCCPWTFLILASRTGSKILDWWILTLHIVSHWRIWTKRLQAIFFAVHDHLLSWEQTDEESLDRLVSGLFHRLSQNNFVREYSVLLYWSLQNHLFYLLLLDLDMLLAIFAVLALCNRISIFEIWKLYFVLISKLVLLAPINHLLGKEPVGNKMRCHVAVFCGFAAFWYRTTLDF